MLHERFNQHILRCAQDVHLRNTPIIFYCIFLFAISVLTGCTADLEREDIPVSFGVRLDQPIPPSQFRADMQRLKAYAPQEIALELYVCAHDSTGLPYIDRTCRAQLPKLLPILQELDLQPSLVFSESPDQPLFFKDTTDFRRWFAHYAFEIERVLERTAGHPLRCLVFGNEFRDLESRPPSEWQVLTDSIRADCDAKLVYTTLPSRMSEVEFWPLVDEIGLAYMPRPRATSRKRTASGTALSIALQ